MALLLNVVRELLGGVSVQFGSAYSLEESIRRLRAQTEKGRSTVSSDVWTLGQFSGEKVSLHKVKGGWRNSFRAFFKGKFRLETNGVLLEGQFTRPLVIKIFMGFWFGFVALWTLVSCFFALSTVLMPDKTLGVSLTILFPLFGASMLIVGYMLVRLGAWWSRGDIAYLSGVIVQALGAEPLEPGSPYSNTARGK